MIKLFYHFSSFHIHFNIALNLCTELLLFIPSDISWNKFPYLLNFVAVVWLHLPNQTPVLAALWITLHLTPKTSPNALQSFWEWYFFTLAHSWPAADIFIFSLFLMKLSHSLPQPWTVCQISVVTTVSICDDIVCLLHKVCCLLYILSYLFLHFPCLDCYWSRLNFFFFW